MAENQYVNKVTYAGETLIDLTQDTAEEGDVIQGKTFHLKSGAMATGTLGDATQSASGLMSASDKIKLDGIAQGATANVGTITGITMNGASKGTSGVVDLGTVITAHQDISGKADKSSIPTKVSQLTNDSGYTTNTGTVTKVSAGAGLTGGDVTTTGTIKANLTSETKLTNAAADGTETANRVYPVRLDANGKLAVNVPWVDTWRPAYSLPLAANGTRGGVQIGYTQNGKNYPVQLSSEKMYVNVPWENTTYSSKAAASGGTDVSLCTTGEKYTWNSKTSNTGTVTKVSTGAGLTGGDVTTTGTIKANLTSETKLTNAAADGTETSGRVYPVRLDKNGKMAVNVPWTDHHAWSDITNKPDSAIRWPAWAEVTSKPATATRWPAWTEVTSRPSALSAFTDDLGYRTVFITKTGVNIPNGSATSSVQVDVDISSSIPSGYTLWDVLINMKSGSSTYHLPWYNAGMTIFTRVSAVASGHVYLQNTATGWGSSNTLYITAFCKKN